MRVSRLIRIRMRKVWNKSFRENQNKFIFRVFCENLVICGMMRKKYERTRQATDDNIICRMPFAFWITKTTNTHSEYEIFIAFPRQQWLCGSVSRLRYRYTVCYYVSVLNHNQLFAFLHIQYVYWRYWKILIKVLLSWKINSITPTTSSCSLIFLLPLSPLKYKCTLNYS